MDLKLRNDANAIIANGSGNTGTVGTMTIGITFGRTIFNKVPTIYIICKTIIIVIDIIFTVQLSLVYPKVILQVGVFGIDTGIDNGYNRALIVDLGYIP